MSRLQDRLDKIESLLGPPPWEGIEPQTVRIGGGIAGEEFMHATAGRLYFRRGLHEAQTSFEERVWVAACEAHEPLIVLGGLPDEPAELDASEG